MSERCTPRMRRTGPQRGELGWLDPRTERRLSHSNGADEELSDETSKDPTRYWPGKIPRVPLMPTSQAASSKASKKDEKAAKGAKTNTITLEETMQLMRDIRIRTYSSAAPPPLWLWDDDDDDFEGKPGAFQDHNDDDGLDEAMLEVRTEEEELKALSRVAKKVKRTMEPSAPPTGASADDDDDDDDDFEEKPPWGKRPGKIPRVPLMPTSQAASSKASKKDEKAAKGAKTNTITLEETMQLMRDNCRAAIRRQNNPKTYNKCKMLPRRVVGKLTEEEVTANLAANDAAVAKLFKFLEDLKYHLTPEETAALQSRDDDGNVNCVLIVNGFPVCPHNPWLDKSGAALARSMLPHTLQVKLTPPAPPPPPHGCCTRQSTMRQSTA